jgi:hypothetical protein
MSEEPLQRAEQAIDDARKAAAEAPIMPFDSGPAGATPEQTGGAVAEHGNDEPEDREAEEARTQIGQGSTEEGRSANAAADAAEAEHTEHGEARQDEAEQADQGEQDEQDEGGGA